MSSIDTYKTLKILEIDGQKYSFYDLNVIAKKFNFDLSSIPSSTKILLENLLRHENGEYITSETIPDETLEQIIEQAFENEY